ncbi:MAG: DMT family transporter [Synergistaceae bacterium]|nr:DMT family transporter [Synergistaceae bacterium]
MLYGIFFSVLTCFCWGSTSFLLRGIKGLDAAEMSLMRACGGLICALGLASFVRGADMEAPGAAQLLIFVALVLCNNLIGDVFLFFALHRLGVARGSAIASSYPVLVAVASYLFFDSPLTPAIAAGTLSVVAGVALLCRKGRSEGKLSFSGLAYAVLASVFWAAGLVFNKELLVEGLSPATIVLGRGITFFSLAFLLWLFRLLAVKRDSSAWRNLLRCDSLYGLLAGGSSLGFGAWFYSRALEYVSPSVATPIGASNPVIASVLSMIVYKEQIRPAQWAGIALAVGGSILVTL